MKHYLVITTTTFYDGHGEGDHGGITKSVSTDGKYADLSEGVEYDDWQEITEEMEENYQESDGYNCEVTSFEFKAISKSDYDSFKEIIKSYNNI